MYHPIVQVAQTMPLISSAIVGVNFLARALGGGGGGVVLGHQKGTVLAFQSRLLHNPRASGLELSCLRI